jgi:hypothetical protein
VPLRNDQFDSNINLEPTNTNQLDSLPEISEKCEVHSLGDEYKPDHCSKATFSTALAADSDYKKV